MIGAKRDWKSALWVTVVFDTGNMVFNAGKMVFNTGEDPTKPFKTNLLS